MKFYKKYVLMISFILLLTSPCAGAADRYVTTSGSDTTNDCTIAGSPCGSIEHAINEADSGDTIKVALGTYYENINISESGLNPVTIQGGWNTSFTTQNTDPSVTVIDGGQTDRVFYIQVNNATTALTIDGFKIVNGDNVTSGGGIYLYTDGQTTHLTLKNNIIMNNAASGSGGGVSIDVSDAGGSIVFNAEKNRITNNETGAGNGAGIYIWVDTDCDLYALLRNNIIADNGKDSWSYGLSAMGYGGTCTIDLINNTITNNGKDPYGGVRISSGLAGGVTILNSTNNIIRGNATVDLKIFPWDALSTSQVNAKYSDIGIIDLAGLNGGTGVYIDNGNNIDLDPVFLNASTGNYHLKSGSPCIDAAIFDKEVFDPMFGWVYYNFFVPSDDFEGDSRDSDWTEGPVNTYHKYCDIGADEWTPAVNIGAILQLLLTAE